MAQENWILLLGIAKISRALIIVVLRRSGTRSQKVWIGTIRLAHTQ